MLKTAGFDNTNYRRISLNLTNHVIPIPPKLRQLFHHHHMQNCNRKKNHHLPVNIKINVKKVLFNNEAEEKIIIKITQTKFYYHYLALLHLDRFKRIRYIVMTQ